MTMPTMTLTIDRYREHDYSVANWECAALTPEVAWRGGLRALQAHLDGAESGLAKVMISGAIVTDLAVIPKTDGSENYTEWFYRIQPTTAPEAPVLFYARGLPAYDRHLFEVLLSAVGPVFSAFGLSRNEVDIELFCGRYGATPGGIHREFCSNNHFVLDGQKFMHFWHGDEWMPRSIERDNALGPVGDADEEYLTELDVDSVITHATSLKAGKGQLFSWKNGIWHVGETKGLALALNLARYMSSFDPSEKPLLLEYADDGQVTLGWLNRYQEFLDSDVTKDAALALASSFGIHGAQPSGCANNIPLTLRRRTHAPVLWCSLEDDLLVGTHGASRRFPRTAVSWLSALCRQPVGSPHPVLADSAVEQLAGWLIANSAVIEHREPAR